MGDNKSAQKVLLDLGSNIYHSQYDEIKNYPPRGVEYEIPTYIQSAQPWKLIRSLHDNYLPGPIKHPLRHVYVSAMNAYTSNVDGGEGVDLVHACNILTGARKGKPWVFDAEGLGYSSTLGPVTATISGKAQLEKEFSSEECKKIMPYTEWGRGTFEHYLDVSGFEDKIEVLYPAMHTVPEPRREDGKTIRLLFVGSVNCPGDFYYKGGEYALKCFESVSNRYDVELTIRSIVPPEIKKKYQNVEGVIFIEEALSKEEFHKLYACADVSLFPAHHYALMTTLESMAYGLPIVTIDGEGSAEFVNQGKTGFLAKPSNRILTPGMICFNWSKFKPLYVDPATVSELAIHLTTLIESGSLRRRMGKEARRVIEKGKFSIRVRNQKLKRIYAEAM